MVFAAVAVVLALCLSPIVAHFGGKPVWVQVLVIALCMPVGLVILACLSASLRPGSLGRSARRLRRR